MRVGIVSAVAPKASSIERAALAVALSRLPGRKEPGTAEEIALRRWRDDHGARLLIKAAATPGSTEASGWGAEWAGNAWGEFLGSLAPYSAIGAIASQGLISPLEGRGRKAHPVRTSTAAPMSWVSELDAMPITSYTTGAAVLTPKKMAVATVFSRELLKYGDAEAVFGRLFREDAALSVDAAYFSTAAESTAAHAGLLNGVTATPIYSSMPAETLADLASAVAPGGSGEIVYVTSQERAARFPILHPESKATMLGSAAVPADRVICLDPTALIHGFEGMPDIDVAADGALHMSDTPQPLSDSGTADPVRSLWQTDGMSLRCILEIGFTKRRSNAAAFCDGVTW